MVAHSETYDGSLGDARAFCEVVDFGTISAAARRLGESKGSISRRISRLEAKLGVRLLARTPRAVTTTEEGLAFHGKALAGLALLDEAAEAARGQREIPRGHLRITAAVDIAIELLPPFIATFRDRYPQISVGVIATDSPIDLAAHRIDLAVRIGMGELPDQAYRGVELARGSIGFFASPYWISSHALPQLPSEIDMNDLVVSEKQGPGRTFRFGHKDGRFAEVRGRAGVQVTDLAMALRLAEEGAGIALLPDLITSRAILRGSIVPVLADWKIAGLRLHAITLAGRDVPARVRLFRDYLKDCLDR
jgi:DNA-binding transcriptional LysR family regulator